MDKVIFAKLTLRLVSQTDTVLKFSKDVLYSYMWVQQHQGKQLTDELWTGHCKDQSHNPIRIQPQRGMTK